MPTNAMKNAPRGYSKGAKAPSAAPAATPAPLPGTPSDFVYAGRRVAAKGNYLVDKLFLIDAAGKIGAVGVYKADRARKVIGGIYTGARFSEATSYGVATAKWTGNYVKDRALRIQWEAEEAEAVREYKGVKLHKDAKQVSLINSALEPVRAVYTAAQARGDYDTCAALDVAVSLALRHPLKVRP